MRYAVKFTYAKRDNWNYCIENGVVKTFETKAEAEAFAASAAKAVQGLGLGHVYQVVEY